MRRPACWSCSWTGQAKMSGPNPPGREPDEPDSVGEHSRAAGPAGGPESPEPIEPDAPSHPPHELEPLDSGPIGDHTGQTDVYSRAYSAPESEHFTSGPYVPADHRLYDYDGYEESPDLIDESSAPRWPWIVGVTAIVAAIALDRKSV